MDEVERDDPLGEESLDGMLGALFGSPSGDDDASVLKQIGRVCGVAPEVLLRDPAEEHAPVLRGADRDGQDAVEDDSRYQVLGEIGRGGVGIVYQARDRDLGRSVALKVLRPEHAENAEVVQRFVEEAQVEGQLQHPGIVPVHSLGIQPDGRPSFAMKLVRGKTLADSLANRTDPAADRHRFLSVFERVAQAIAYAHQRGVVHRDLKPGNVMLGMFGEVQVLDWGFAKVLGRGEEPPEEKPDQTIIATVRSEGGDSTSIAGSVMGTPAYMPPEQARGRVEEVDQRTDVFALGAILTEVLTGAPPYVGDRADLLTMAIQARLDDAHSRLDACEAETEWTDLARSCLAPLRADRPRHAAAVAEEVHRILSAAEERARQAEIQAARERMRREQEQARLASERLRAKKLEAEVAEAKARAEEQRREGAREARRVQAERNRRRALVLTAASLCLVVAVAVAGWIWYRAEAAKRARAVENRVSRALQVAETHAGREEWGPAAEAARSAVGLAEGAREETRDRANHALARIEEARAVAEARSAQAEKDRSVLRQLEEAFLARFDGQRRDLLHDPVLTERELNAAFREHGLDLDEAGDEQIVSFIGGSSIRDELTAALDQWLWHSSQEASSDRDPDRRYGRRADILLRVLARLDPDTFRSEVRAALRSGDGTRALGLARPDQLATCDPRFVVNLCFGVFAGECCNMERAEAMLPILRDAHRRAPDDFWVLHGLATFFEALGRHEDALPLREITVSLRPRSPGLWSRLAWLRRALGDAAGSRAAVEVVRGLDPKDVGGPVLEGRFLAREGDFAGALAKAEEALRIRPEDGSALLLKAYAHRAKGESGAAAEAYERAKEASPDRCDVRLALAWHHWTEGRWSKAIALFREGIRLEPACIQSRKYLADFLGNAGRYDEAVEVLDQAVGMAPGDGELRAALSVFLTRAGRLDEAEVCLREAVRLEPENPVAGSARSPLQRARGQWRESLATRRLMVRMAPTWWTYHRLGGELAEYGYHPEAQTAFREAIRLFGKATDLNFAELGWVLMHHGWCLCSSGRRREGLDLLRRAVALLPGEPTLQHVLGSALLADGDLEGALAAADRAIEIGGGTGALDLRAGVLFRIGRVRDAIDALKRVLEIASGRVTGQPGAFLGSGLQEHEAFLDVWQRVLPHLPRRAEVLAGGVEVDDSRTALGLALYCCAAGRHEAACGYYRVAFGTGLDPLLEGHLAGAAGCVIEVATPESRDQALAWLRIHLQRQEARLASPDFWHQVEARRALWYLRSSKVLSGFRAETDGLPEGERDRWKELWRDADAMLQRALEKGE